VISRQAEVYLVLEEVPTTFNGFVAAFDVISVDETDTTSEPIELRNLTIEEVRIPSYPEFFD